MPKTMEVKEKKRCPFCGANYFCVDWMVGQYFWFDKQGISREGEMDWGGDYSAVYCGECRKEIPSEIWGKWDINLCPCFESNTKNEKY